MKKIMTLNCWLSMIAWSLFLGDNPLLASTILAIYSLFLMIKKEELNYWRIVSIYLIFYICSLFFVGNTNVVLYFRHTYLFLAVYVLNNCIANECLCDLSRNYKKELSFISLFVFIFFIIITCLLPFDRYSLIGKDGLFALLICIFSPTLFGLLVDFLSSILAARNCAK